MFSWWVYRLGSEPVQAWATTMPQSEAVVAPVRLLQNIITELVILCRLTLVHLSSPYDSARQGCCWCYGCCCGGGFLWWWWWWLRILVADVFHVVLNRGVWVVVGGEKMRLLQDVRATNVVLTLLDTEFFHNLCTSALTSLASCLKLCGENLPVRLPLHEISM